MRKTASERRSREKNSSTGNQDRNVFQPDVGVALIKTRWPNLWLLPAGSLPPKPDEMLASDRMSRLIKTLRGMANALDKAGVTAQCTRAWTLGGLFFRDRPVRNYDDAKAADHATYARFFHGLLERGVYVAPSGYETLFPSLAHTDDDLASMIEAVADVAASL